MSTNPPGGISGDFLPAPTQPSVEAPTDLFSSETFMSVLAAQIANQNPLEPMSDTEFIAQMAQFGQIEQTTRMSEALEAMSLSSGLADGSALIGRSVTYAAGGDGEPLTGTVDRLTVGADGSLELIVGGASIEMDWITQVAEAGEPDAAEEDAS